MLKWMIGAILLLPLAELAVFIAVAASIGLLRALGLLFASTLIGLLLLRHAGRAQIARFRDTVTETGGFGIEVGASSFLLVLAGVLLFLPGFLTDVVGLALLIGPVRRWLGGAVQRWLSPDRGDRRGGPGGGDRSVVDLAPEEWQRVPDRELQNRSRERRDDQE
jgi:UPF0716 protein FxsA